MSLRKGRKTGMREGGGGDPFYSSAWLSDPLFVEGGREGMEGGKEGRLVQRERELGNRGLCLVFILKGCDRGKEEGRKEGRKEGGEDGRRASTKACPPTYALNPPRPRPFLPFPSSFSPISPPSSSLSMTKRGRAKQKMGRRGRKRKKKRRRKR